MKIGIVFHPIDMYIQKLASNALWKKSSNPFRHEEHSIRNARRTTGNAILDAIASCSG
jgi:hypothetical protein